MWHALMIQFEQLKLSLSYEYLNWTYRGVVMWSFDDLFEIKREQSLGQTVQQKLPVIWDKVAPMWCECNTLMLRVPF